MIKAYLVEGYIPFRTVLLRDTQDPEIISKALFLTPQEAGHLIARNPAIMADVGDTEWRVVSLYRDSEEYKGLPPNG